MTEWLPFRLAPQARRAKLAAFHERAEIGWSGFEGVLAPCAGGAAFATAAAMVAPAARSTGE